MVPVMVFIRSTAPNGLRFTTWQLLTRTLYNERRYCLRNPSIARLMVQGELEAHLLR